MNGNELIRRLKKLGAQRGVSVWLDESRGKGSHATLYFDTRFTVIRSRKDELKTGTLAAMLSQLGLTKADLN